MGRLLENKTALVVGGSGMIGRATALLFAEHGAAVGVHYFRNRECADEVADDVRRVGGRCATFCADVTTPKGAQALVRDTIATLGRVDVLVNCAGIARDNAVQFLSELEWDQVIGVNLHGSLYTCKAVCEHMVERRSGHIVNIASVTGLTGQELRTNYGASKGAVIAMTKCIARELGPFGIRANAIAPQIIEGGLSSLASARFVKETTRFTPVGRIGKGSDVAGTALYLASDLSEFVTGEVVFVTGGLFTHQL